MITIYCQIKVIQHSQYTMVIAEDLNRSLDDDLKYVAITIPPNWQYKSFEVDDIGYLTFESVSAGDKYYDRDEDEQKIYKFSANYLNTFVHETKKINIQTIRLN